jgi:hypothetical protein
MRRALAVAVVLVACGGASSNATNVSVPAASASSSASAQPAVPEASIVHYDDLGLSFAVPRALHVMGDDELASRVRASANAHLQADLRSRASAKKGVPLLALTGTDMNVTLLIVAVPPDATSLELAAHQRDAMAANLASFETASPPKQLMTDGVPGAELSTRYMLDNVGMSSRMRVYVRAGVGTILTVAWKATADAASVQGILDGIHFAPLP